MFLIRCYQSVIWNDEAFFFSLDENLTIQALGGKADLQFKTRVA